MRVNKSQRKQGFSLVEVLVVTSILGLICVAILATFSTGLNTFSKIQNYATVNIDLLLSLDRFERDVRNAFLNVELPLVGEISSVRLPGFNILYNDDDQEEGSLGRYCYQFDRVNKNFTVGWQSYGQATFSNEPNPEDIEVLSSVENIEFRYYDFDQDRAEGIWLEQWQDNTKLPLGIEVRVNVKDGQEDVLFVRKIFIPSSQQIEEEESDDTETLPEV